MEVTKRNFKVILPQVEEAIKTASFVTIDGEFTGLNNGPTTNAYDSPAQYYDKIRSGAMDFLFIQFGLCAFKYDPVTKGYSHQVYNFYVFPTPSSYSAPDTRFLCQSSSIDFLSSNGFDFNKLFRYGIPYLTKKDHEELEKKLKFIQDVRKNSNRGNNILIIPPDCVEVVDDICQRIETFINDDSSATNEIELPHLNAFVRRLIHQEVEIRFPNAKIILDKKILPDKSVVLIVRKGVSKEDYEIEKCNRENEDLESAVGFSAVIQLLTKYNTVLVGHNMLLDLCHIVNRFCMELPPDYISFKSVVNLIFPKIFDTKYMCSVPPLKDLISNSALLPLLESIQSESSKIKLVTSDPSPKKFGYVLNDKKLHEAGYDAYITGIIFLSLSSYVHNIGKKTSFEPAPIDSKVLTKYMNKLFLMRLQDYLFIDLTGTEPQPDRSHVFYVEFPEQWKSNNIVDLFSKYGAINISWVNNKSAIIALHRRDEKFNVINDLINPFHKVEKNKIITKKEYSIIRFDQFEEMTTPKANKIDKKEDLRTMSTSCSKNESKEEKVMKTNKGKDEDFMLLSSKRKRTVSNDSSSSSTSGPTSAICPKKQDTSKTTSAVNNKTNTRNNKHSNGSTKMKKEKINRAIDEDSKKQFAEDPDWD